MTAVEDGGGPFLIPQRVGWGGKGSLCPRGGQYHFHSMGAKYLAAVPVSLPPQLTSVDPANMGTNNSLSSIKKACVCVFFQKG